MRSRYSDTCRSRNNRLRITFSRGRTGHPSDGTGHTTTSFSWDGASRRRREACKSSRSFKRGDISDGLGRKRSRWKWHHSGVGRAPGRASWAHSIFISRSRRSSQSCRHDSRRRCHCACAKRRDAGSESSNPGYGGRFKSESTSHTDNRGGQRVWTTSPARLLGRIPQ
jgi:hypothetical protein